MTLIYKATTNENVVLGYFISPDVCKASCIISWKAFDPKITNEDITSFKIKLHTGMVIHVTLELLELVTYPQHL